MKLRKIMAGVVASALAVSTFATMASANCLKKVEGGDAGLNSGDGSWLVQVFNTGNPEEGKPAVKYDIDYTKVTGAKFTVKVVEGAEDFEGNIGGAVVLSINGGDVTGDLYSKYNWPGKEYWGVLDEAAGLETLAADKAVTAKTLGDYTYEIEANGFDNPFVVDGVKEIGCMQIALQEWGSEVFGVIEVQSCDVLDADGNVLVSFDATGKASLPNIAGGEEAPAPESSEDPAPESSEDPAPESSEDPAPAPESSDAPTTDTKPNTETGAEGIAVAAGLAVLATGVAIVAKKRK